MMVAILLKLKIVLFLHASCLIHQMWLCWAFWGFNLQIFRWPCSWISSVWIFDWLTWKARWAFFLPDFQMICFPFTQDNIPPSIFLPITLKGRLLDRGLCWITDTNLKCHFLGNTCCIATSNDYLRRWFEKSVPKQNRWTCFLLTHSTP